MITENASKKQAELYEKSACFFSSFLLVLSISFLSIGFYSLCRDDPQPEQKNALNLFVAPQFGQRTI